MWVEELKSGRWRGGFRIPGGRKIHQTFDYEYEAEAWASAAEQRARRAVQEGRGDVPAARTESTSTGSAEASQIPSSAPTLTETLTTWVNAKRVDWAETTTRSYVGQIREIKTDKIAKMRIDEIHREDLDLYVARLLSGGTGRPAVNARIARIKSALSYAVECGRLAANPAAKMKKLRYVERKTLPISSDVERRILDACRSDEERAMMLLALDAGLRLGEVQGLSADAIVGDYLHLRQIVLCDTRTVRQGLKGGKTRVVPMTPRLARALEVVALVASVRGHDALLFVREDGLPWSAEAFRDQIWHRIAREAGLPFLDGELPRFHDLRHAYGSKLGAAGVPRHEIKTLLGHSDERTTARYVHEGTDGHRLSLVTRALVDA